jgi:ParB/RepB/Spo0J family partition protein
MTKTKTHNPDAVSASDTYQLIDLSLIVPSEDNVRVDIGDVTDLAQSVYTNGLQQPPRVVGPLTDANGNPYYKLIAGHRRIAAITQLAEAGQWVGPVGCMVTAAIDDAARVSAMIVENLQRSDLNPIEEARAFFRLTKEFKWKQNELALQVGRSGSYISDRLSLLKLPDEVLDRVGAGALPLGIALELAKIGDDAAVLKLTKRGVPSLPDIDAVIRTRNSDKSYADFVAALDELGIDHSERLLSYDERAKSEIVGQPTTVKELRELVGTGSTSKLFATVAKRNWSGVAECVVRRTLTEAQIAKRQRDAEAERQKQQEAWTTEQAVKEEARRAELSPELLAWEDEVMLAKRDHIVAISDYEDKRESTIDAWVASVTAKDVARWAMLFIVTLDPYSANRVAAFFRLDTNNVDPQVAVELFCQESAANLVKVVAYVLTQESDEELAPANQSLNEFVTKHLGARPTLVLPTKPGLTDDAPGEYGDWDEADYDIEDNMAGEFTDTEHED